MDLNKFLKFLELAGKLKTTIRFSTVDESLKLLRDTSASHSWRLSLLVILMTDELKLNINKQRALEIAIVHDIAESITGDIDATLIHRGLLTKKQKQKKEIVAIKKLAKTLSGKPGKKILALWQEYEYGLNREAKFVKALDKIETILQILETGYVVFDEPDFLAKYADKAVSDFPELKAFLKIIKIELKKKFKKGKIPWKKEFEENL